MVSLDPSRCSDILGSAHFVQISAVATTVAVDPVDPPNYLEDGISVCGHPV